MSNDIKEEFWKALDKSAFMLVRRDGASDHAIPMTAQLDADNRGWLYFFHTRDGRLAQGGPAMAHFAAKGHDLFACIAGTLSPVTDRAIIDKYWSNQVAAWYPGGQDDPNLLMLRFDLRDAEIWTADPGVVGLFKMMTGMTMRDEEMGQHAEVDLSRG